MARKIDRRLSPEQASLIHKSRTLKSGKVHYRLDNATLVALVAFIERDIRGKKVLRSLPKQARQKCDYYSCDPEFNEVRRACRAVDFTKIFLEAKKKIDGFERVFETLCELHKRRLKMKNIRATKAMPSASELSFRGLLAEPGVPADILATQLSVGKYFYDLDNRQAQESALLFNLIVANCLGGKQHTGKTSPIMCAENNYRGRAVDCIKGQRAYDFKARLTEAPSRRARLSDEIKFPRDCNLSGYTPILLAFHQDPGVSTQRLIDAYERYGGMVMIGNDAWFHIRKEAGPAMSKFLDKYVISRLSEIEAVDRPALDMTFRMRETYNDYVYRDGRGPSRRVRVRPAASCA